MTQPHREAGDPEPLLPAIPVAHRWTTAADFTVVQLSHIDLHRAIGDGAAAP